MPRTAAKSAKKTVKPRSAKPKPRAPAKPRTAMPDISRPSEPPETITAEAYKAGAYELQPQYRNRDPVAPVAPVDLSAMADFAKAVMSPPESAEAAPEASEGPGEGDEAIVEPEPAPEPLTHVRMVHDEPDATADPYPAHPAGGIVVPMAAIASLRSCGFRVEHEHEKPS